MYAIRSYYAKSQDLLVETTDILLDETLYLTGVLTNGASPITDANVYLAFYDAFDPPSVITSYSIHYTKLYDRE